MQGEAGYTENGLHGVRFEASDISGKRVFFSDLQQADGTARFTVKTEAGAELSAERIGKAICRRLGHAAGWTSDSESENGVTPAHNSEK